MRNIINFALKCRSKEGREAIAFIKVLLCELMNYSRGGSKVSEMCTSIFFQLKQKSMRKIQGKKVKYLKKSFHHFNRNREFSIFIIGELSHWNSSKLKSFFIFGRTSREREINFGALVQQQNHQQQMWMRKKNSQTFCFVATCFHLYIRLDSVHEYIKILLMNI